MNDINTGDIVRTHLGDLCRVKRFIHRLWGSTFELEVLEPGPFSSLNEIIEEKPENITLVTKAEYSQDFLQYDIAKISGKKYQIVHAEEAQEAMIRFAQYHVKQAIEAIKQNVKVVPLLQDYLAGSWEKENPVDLTTIEHAYPLENIK